MENKREWDGYFNYEFDVQSVNNGIDIIQFNNNYFDNKRINGNIFTFKKDECSNNKKKSKSILINGENLFNNSFPEVQKLKKELNKFQEENTIYKKKELIYIKEINEKDKLIKELDEKNKKLQNINSQLNDDNKKLIELINIFKIISDFDKKDSAINKNINVNINNLNNNNINKENINIQQKKIPNPKKFINISNNTKTNENTLKNLNDIIKKENTLTKINSKKKINKNNSKNQSKEKNNSLENNFINSYLFQGKNYINIENPKTTSSKNSNQETKNYSYKPHQQFEKGIITISSCSNNSSGNNSLIYIENRSNKHYNINSKYSINSNSIHNNNYNLLSEDFKVTNNNTFNSNDYKDIIDRLNKYKETNLNSDNNNNLFKDKIPFQFLDTEKLYKNIIKSRFGEI